MKWILAIVIFVSGLWAIDDTSIEQVSLAITGTDLPSDEHNMGLPLSAEQMYLPLITRLMQEDSAINQMDVDGITALLAAARSGNFDMVKILKHMVISTLFGPNTYAVVGTQMSPEHSLLITTSAIINSTDFQQDPVVAPCARPSGNNDHLLHFAAEHGYLSLAQRMMQADEDVNQINNEGMTPLLAAARAGRFDMVKFLVKHGARIDFADRKGATALTWAAAHGHKLTVEFLVAAGSDVSKCDEQCCSRISREPVPSNVKGALTRGLRKREFIQKLRACIDTNNTDGISKLLPNLSSALLNLTYQGNTPLVWAVQNNHIDIARKLIKAGADSEQKNNYGVTPIVAAMHAEQSEPLLQLFIESHLNIDIQDAQGRTALATAIDLDKTACAMILITSGAVVNIADKKGDTPLSLAIKRNNVPLIMVLLEKGAQVNSRDSKGITPLMLATATCSPSITKSLMFFGADSTALDHAGKMVIDYASTPEQRMLIRQALVKRLCVDEKCLTK